MSKITLQELSPALRDMIQNGSGSGEDTGVERTVTNEQLAPDIKIGSLAQLQTTNKQSVTGAINEVAKYKNAANISVADSSNLFTSKNVEGVLKELFTFANNGKTGLASVIGSPATSSYTFDQIKNFIQTQKANLAANINSKGGAASNSETLQSLVNKVSSISTSTVPNWVRGVWAYAADMPTARHQHKSAVVDNTIYVFGGLTGGTSYRVGSFEAFNTVTNKWSSKSNPAGGTTVGHTLFSYGGKIYCAGGKNSSSEASRAVYEYSPLTNTWSTLSDKKVAAKSQAYQEYNGRFYFFGGINASDAILQSCEVFNPSTKGWATITNMPTARSRHTTARINDKIFVIGGWNGSTSLATVEWYDCTLGTWTTRRSLGTARRNLTCDNVNNKLYAIGGASTSTAAFYSNTVEMYDSTTNTWTTKASMRTGRHSHSSAVVNGKIYVFGGFVGSDTATADTEIYDPTTNTWTRTKTMRQVRANMTANVVNGNIFAIGGSTASIGNECNYTEIYLT